MKVFVYNGTGTEAEGTDGLRDTENTMKTSLLSTVVKTPELANIYIDFKYIFSLHVELSEVYSKTDHHRWHHCTSHHVPN
jgi:hypothetical protein